MKTLRLHIIVIEPSQYMYKYLEINAIIAKQTMAQ